MKINLTFQYILNHIFSKQFEVYFMAYDYTNTTSNKDNYLSSLCPQ